MSPNPVRNDEHVTYMPAEQFDELARTLDEPDHICGWTLPSGQHIPPSQCAACEREKLTYWRSGVEETMKP